MYGHTHKPVVDREGDLTAVNPGSLTYPRQEGRRPSFIIMDLDRKGRRILRLTICEERFFCFLIERGFDLP